MRINVRAAGVALAAAVGILALTGGMAQAASNVGNSGLINTDTINALNVQACNSPVNAVIGATVDVASPRSVDNCVNAGGQVGGTTGGDSNVGNQGLLNTGKVNAGNVQLCNSPVNAGIAATVPVLSPYDVKNCVNSGGSVGATDLGGHKNVGNQGLVGNLADVNAANAQLCNSPVNGAIGFNVPVASPQTVGECVNSGAKVPGDNAYKATKPVAAKPAVKTAVKTVTKAKPAKAPKIAKAKPAKKSVKAVKVKASKKH